MFMFPLLSLSHIEMDPELARRLPRRLAYYHLALPIAEDDDQVTIAMAYPENHRVVEVIQTALGTPVIPVRSHADDIRRVLDTVWQPQDDIERTGLVCWTLDETNASALYSYGEGIATALALTQSLNAAPNTEAFIEHIREPRPALVLCQTTEPKTHSDLLTHVSTSIMMLRGSYSPPKRILHVLRGHTPDKRTLDWVIPIAQHYDAQITLLVAATAVEPRRGNPLMSDFASLILPEHPAHVMEYGQMLASMNLHGRIRVTNGLLEDGLQQTLEAEPYDLVAIATENNGKFVKSVLARLSHNTSNFLVIKP